MTAESEDLRSAVASLTVATGDLKVTVGKLETTLNFYVLRDTEDRGAFAKLDSRVSTLEKWRARIQGQIALALVILGLVDGYLLTKLWP